MSVLCRQEASMRDGQELTSNEVVRHAFKGKFDAKGARLRTITEWLLARFLCFTTLPMIRCSGACCTCRLALAVSLLCSGPESISAVCLCCQTAGGLLATATS